MRRGAHPSLTNITYSSRKQRSMQLLICILRRCPANKGVCFIHKHKIIKFCHFLSPKRHKICFSFWVTPSPTPFRGYVPGYNWGISAPRLTNIRHALVMAALCNRAGHYIFALWFVSSSSSVFSSPNLSRCRLDVYHTSVHGVALVRI